MIIIIICNEDIGSNIAKDTSSGLWVTRKTKNITINSIHPGIMFQFTQFRVKGLSQQSLGKKLTQRDEQPFTLNLTPFKLHEKETGENMLILHINSAYMDLNLTHSRCEATVLQRLAQ